MCSSDFIAKKIVGRKYCSNKCQLEFQYQQKIRDWKEGKISGLKGGNQCSAPVRRYLFEKFNSTCCGCGLTEWRGLPITLEVEHLDGNHSNHKESNLLLLCPNCHSQTETYRGKNKGNGRYARMQRYREGKSY
jgi:5-methylcytosine-specific restriction endonuclease McrA